MWMQSSLQVSCFAFLPWAGWPGTLLPICLVEHCVVSSPDCQWCYEHCPGHIQAHEMHVHENLSRDGSESRCNSPSVLPAGTKLRGPRVLGGISHHSRRASRCAMSWEIWHCRTSKFHQYNESEQLSRCLNYHIPSYWWDNPLFSMATFGFIWELPVHNLVYFSLRLSFTMYRLA